MATEVEIKYDDLMELLKQPLGGTVFEAEDWEIIVVGDDGKTMGKFVFDKDV